MTWYGILHAHYICGLQLYTDILVHNIWVFYPEYYYTNVIN